MESLASLRPSWCFEYSDHVTLSHHDTSCHICTEFASEIGSHQTSHSQQLKPRQLGPKYVQSMSKVCPGEFGSLEALVPRLIELLKKSRPMLLLSLESTPQCCYMGVSSGVSIHGGTPLAGWCMMKKHFGIGDLGVHPFMGSPHMHAMLLCIAMLCVAEGSVSPH